ncbi:uncharacterized protein HMPREF1541_05036 [Cyphellophora europaea CBS 101466]|uniref:Xylanolytic transcriptional activator regulatory domain-containing protein n=1 Tax=Cyphellophora europaea (strain CBS 101466) TaxID=1220924 RepID=W2RW59_CYPE1|nr:uncharacterized protein HMPREF1541_05036 [Cyphellophora europaea CBS 101466]ETN40756.1 hypothetical protein HMPREF1541_05036 [Cyphellophora europaea CBS 101466]
MSEVSFILRTLELFDLGAYSPQQSLGPVTEVFNLPLPPDTMVRQPSIIRVDRQSTSALPEKATTLRVVGSVFARDHPFLDFLHPQHFRDMVEIIYEERGTRDEAYVRFLPLLHHVLALGYLFCRKEHETRGCSQAIDTAMKHFAHSQQLLNVIRCDDLLSMQTLLCGAVFLMSTSRIATGHALIGLAASSAMRLGLPCEANNTAPMLQDERQMRDLVFASLLRMDMYTSLILDLPRFIQDDLVDLSLNSLYARLSEEEKIEFRTEASIKHLELLRLTCNARRAVYVNPMTGERIETIDLNQLSSVEGELHRWTEEVSVLFSRVPKSVDLAMQKHFLETASNFSQLILYRPFLHYLRHMADNKAPIPRSQSRHALACVKLASNTILRTQLVLGTDTPVPLSWDTIYTLFLAVMCLVFLISAHNGTSLPSEAWKRASIGIGILYANACVDNGASMCLRVLRTVVQQLNHTVDFDFEEIEQRTRKVCAGERTADMLRKVATERPPPGPAKVSKPFSTSTSTSTGRFADADGMLAHAEDLPLGFGFTEVLNMDSEEDEHTTYTSDHR